MSDDLVKRLRTPELALNRERREAADVIQRLTAENKQLREHIAELEAELEEPEPVSWLAKPEEKKERDPDEWREWEQEKERIRKEFGE